MSAESKEPALPGKAAGPARRGSAKPAGAGRRAGSAKPDGPTTGGGPVGSVGPASAGPASADPASVGPASAGPAGSVAAGAADASGPALARAALDAALTKRRATARPAARSDGSDGDPQRRRGRRGYTGPGPDPRDPQPFGSVLGKLIKSRGWQRPTAEARVFGDWQRVVGEDIAAHCRPIKLEHGELTVEAESTAWATQLRLLAGRLLAGIAREVGTNVVTKLHIHGPAAPSWNRGPRRVRGRGPRDTYG